MDLIWDGDRVLIAGPDTRTHLASLGGAPRPVTGVRLPPGVLPTLLRVPAHELTDLRVPLADVRPELARRLRAPSDLRGVMVAEAEPWVRPTVAALARGVGVARIAEGLGIGERQLHRRALGAFGYGPRTLQTVLRAARALELLRADTPLADAAATAGYADYSHMYRDLRRITGRAPSAFRPGRGDAAQSGA